MTTKLKNRERGKLPATFDGLVQVLTPMAIQDAVHHGNCVEMVDRLMQVTKLSRDQAAYLETLVELVEVYEARHHAIELKKMTGRRMLKHVVEEAGFSASNLARVLGVHPSMGSKILKGERELTWDHAKILGEKYKLAPAYFMG